MDAPAIATLHTARINAAFQTSLRRALFPSQQSLSSQAAAGSRSERKKEKHPPSLDDLERFAHERWDRVLHFLVGSESETDSSLSKGVKDLLLTSNLTQRWPRIYSLPGPLRFSILMLFFVFRFVI